MFDLDLFYVDEEHTQLEERPNLFKFNQAVSAVDLDATTLLDNAQKHYESKMWQWFDSYRFWDQDGQQGIMFEQPTLQNTITELSNHFRQAFKASRQAMVEEIKVTVGGREFDGDEISRARMTTAILAATDDIETVSWALADNTVASVNRVQLKEALRLSGQQMEAIWFQP